MGFAAAWYLEPVLARRRIRPLHRLAAAAVWALLWTVITHGWWWGTFYNAPWVWLLFGLWPRFGLLAMLAGWGFWTLALSAVVPYLRTSIRQPWEDPPAPPLPAEDTAVPLDLPDGTDIGCGIRARRIVIRDHEVNAGMFLCGSTGSGKTNELMKLADSVLRRGVALMFIDGKGSGEVRRYLEQSASRAGRALAVWSFTGPTHYNPLLHGTATENRDKIVETERWGNEHYRRAAEAFLDNVFHAHDGAERRPTLRAATRLLSVPALRKFAQEIPDQDRLDAVMEYLETIDESTRSAAAGLRNRLLTLVDSEAGPWLEPAPEAGPEIDLLDAVDNGGAVLFSLDSLRLPGAAAQVGALLLQDLKTVAARRLARGHPDLCYVIIDEFNIFNGAQVLALLNKCREAGFCTILATQDLSDVAAAGGSLFADQVLANTNVKLILRQDVEASTQRIAATVGTRKVWSTTHLAEDGVPTGRTSVRQVEEPLLNPSVLQRLTQFEGVLVRKTPTLSVERVRLRRAR